MKLAIVGVTGMVGQEMLKVVAEMNLPITELIPVASKKSAGTKITFGGQEHTVVDLEKALEMKPEVALFSAGGSISLEWAPKFAAIKCRVIDNSSAFRMDEDKKLIIPEINGDELTADDYIIANPNCSTIQMLIALAPLHEMYTIKRVVVSTYQSISGTGAQAVKQMENEREGINGEMVYPYPIDQNVLPHCDIFMDNGYTKEEMKLVNETKKILDNKIAVTATAVRVPVQGGHSEALNVNFEKDFDLTEIRKAYHENPAITLQDNPETNTYPMPLYAKGKNDVYVGRLRRDESQDNTLNMWVVADNLRKGAATNTVQIAQKLIEKKIIEIGRFA
ncbi:aspartate-semialdehyde dehydrogenase [Brumimicrobium aurantiacum]|uniref:Aspartate-semialdehyde dehydrogenase n=1 Tax=Brumimicrobium aurantiacum TaxID=1737063 RepID=A0A3E1EX70_9FLAO|nr:aspartate-semialdehyde dehydrogenase [Brumimicrobium aurantiacum]RFC54161.1 aspartate-semialdehyde dehydrogenase [Brumimicrobium aurantiacum]